MWHCSFTGVSSFSPTLAVAPSNIQNLTVLHYISETNTVNFSVSWLNSEFPHGNTSFNVLVATSNGTQILSNQTIYHRSNGKEALVRVYACEVTGANNILLIPFLMKRDVAYSTTIGWLWDQLYFSFLWLAMMCIWGSCSTVHVAATCLMLQLHNSSELEIA